MIKKIKEFHGKEKLSSSFGVNFKQLFQMYRNVTSFIED